jgi:phytoene dehydrogenase-like protein
LRLERGGACAFVAPAVLAPQGDPWPARLVAPLDHTLAARLGPEGQEAHLDRLLAQGWWREGLADVEVVARRVPATWGRTFSLHRDAMNPVMTARLMRRGRLAHRSPHARGLYLCGAATHPGQWVSFCAISGVLAADALQADLT